MHTRILQAEDVIAYRGIRLRALQEHPEAFGSSAEDFTLLSDDSIKHSLVAGQPDIVTIAAFVDDQIVGILTAERLRRPKIRHRANIAGMYVAAEHRGQGYARALMQTALDYLTSLGGVEQVTLSVTSGNAPARRLYRSMGFVTWGVDPAYIRVNEQYHDMEKMILFL